jgi:hypothetical protein
VIENTKQGILNWIRAGENLDVREDFEIYIRRRHEQSCAWIFEDAKFQSWRDPLSNAVLWYNAPLGSGKTILSSTVVQHLKDRGFEGVYFFFSFSDPIRRNLMSGLRALAIQVIQHLKSGIPDMVVDVYEQEIANNVNVIRNSLITKVLLNLLKQCSRIYLVVDGLDEIDADKDTLQIISDLVSSSVSLCYGTVKWFFTSRDDGGIRRMMERLKTIELSPTPSIISQDIKGFLVDKLPTENLTYPIDRLVKYCGNNFLYSRFLSETLSGEGVTCEDDIKDALETFPTSLAGYYLRSFLKICKKMPAEQDLVR